MKILFLSAPKSFGGGERYLTILLPELTKLGHTVYLVTTLSRADSRISEFVLDDVNDLWPDIIVFNGNGALYKWGKYFKFQDARRAFVMHTNLDDPQAGYLKRKLRPIRIKCFLRPNDLIIRVADACVKDTFWRNIRTIHNGIPLPNYTKNFAENSNCVRFAIVGELNKNKNQQIAIRALSNLPATTMLSIIGSGKELDALSDLASDSGLKTRVEFLGHLQEPQAYLEKCDALLITSKAEAFPYAALEAMAIGIPVIASDVGGLKELINHGVNGFLFESNDMDSLVRAMDSICKSRALRVELGNNARMTIQKNFTAYVMATKFAEILEGHNLLSPSWAEHV